MGKKTLIASILFIGCTLCSIGAFLVSKKDKDKTNYFTVNTEF